MKSGAAHPDVLRYLDGTLDSQWRRYQKRLKRCQRQFSEEAVHDSRVETRRLLATLELLRAFLPAADLKKARRVLKKHLDSFDRLRDTQVQLLSVERLLHTQAAAGRIHDWLRLRETRFIRKSREAVKQIRTRRLGKRISGFQRELRRLRKKTKPEQAFNAAQGAIRRAFARVTRLCRRVRAADIRTIHRARIAFKRFRYMVDALSPLLPGIGEQHLQALRGYQSLMGDIQDVDVLIAALDKFIRRHEPDIPGTQQLRAEYARRRRQLLRVYLNSADKLQQFWPLQATAGRLVSTNRGERT